MQKTCGDKRTDLARLHFSNAPVVLFLHLLPSDLDLALLFLDDGKRLPPVLLAHFLCLDFALTRLLFAQLLLAILLRLALLLALELFLRCLFP